MSSSTVRLITACMVILTTLATLTVSFVAALSVVSVLDQPSEGEVGFVFMVGTLNEEHSLIALNVALVVTLGVWAFVMLAIRRDRSSS